MRMPVAKRGSAAAARVAETRIAGATAGDRAEDAASVAAKSVRERRGIGSTNRRSESTK